VRGVEPMSNRILVGLSLIVCQCFVLIVQAQDWHPGNGITYGRGTSEGEYLKHQCSVTLPKFECSFVNISIAPKLDELDREKYIAEYLEKYQDKTSSPAADAQFLDQFCQTTDESLRVLHYLKFGENKDLNPETIEHLDSMSPKQKDILQANMAEIKNICEERPTDYLKRFAEKEAEMAVQTCVMTSTTYERTFEQTSPGIYTSSTGPAGPCGIVTMHTFSPQKYQGMKTPFTNYRQQRIVTNKLGKIGEHSCADEKEWTKDFRQTWKDNYANCVYIDYEFYRRQ
jgi:hypothetical protein